MAACTRSFTGPLTAALVAIAASAGACSPGPGGSDPVTPGTVDHAAAPGRSPSPAGVIGPDDPLAPDRARAADLAATTPQVAILDPAALAALEDRGFGLGELVVGAPAATTEELGRTGLGSVLDVVDADVRAVLAEHPTALVSSVLGTRLFDRRWLRSPEMRFELVGVFDRLDRRAFQAGTCGEIRFLYRLAYTTQQSGAAMHGRLPMMVNVVFLVPEDGAGATSSPAPSTPAPGPAIASDHATPRCAAAATSWRAPSTLRAPTEVARWLADHGGLDAAHRARWTLKSVETNLQTVRVQSTAHASMAGHVEYAMRVFQPVDAAAGGPRTFVPAPMENQLDVARIAAEPALRADLVALLRAPATLRAIDDGTLRLPDRFLARTARSIAPRGLDRPFNRPFRQVLRDADLAELDLASTRTIRSPAALVRRLDGLSCSGCHQSRSIAGFHHVGNDAPDAAAWSSLVSGMSPHLTADLDRRRAYVDAVARGATPDDVRPVAERQGHDGSFGSACGLGDPGFASWTCDAGLRCVAVESPDVGVCLDADPIGAPCEIGRRVVGGRTPVGDRTAGLERRSCGEDLGCSPNISGFALGTCAGHCDDATPAGTCTSMTDIDGLQACLRVGYPEAECAARFRVARADRACDDATPCRQDFVCARAGAGGRGACVPPYFVFPLRLDGYPLKR